MSLPFCPTLSPLVTVFVIPTLKHSLSIEDVLEDLRIIARAFAASFLTRCHRSEVICSLSSILLEKSWFLDCPEQQVSLYVLNNQRFCSSASQFVAHICYCSVDTVLIDGDDRAKNLINGFVVVTEMLRQFPFRLHFQVSSFQSGGSSEYGVSTFTEVEHHVLSDSIPFSIPLYV